MEPGPASVLRCVSCDYDLEGLPRNAKCPECGWRIADSVSGAKLSDAPPRYLRSLANGLTIISMLLIWEPIAYVLLIFFSLGHPVVVWIIIGVRTAAEVLRAFGVRSYTRPDRSWPAGDPWRPVLRYATYAGAAIHVSLVVQLIAMSIYGVMGIGALALLTVLLRVLAAVVAWHAGTQYALVLAVRTTDQSLRDMIRDHQTAAIPLWTIGILALGPLTHYIIYLAIHMSLANAVRSADQVAAKRASGVGDADLDGS